MEELEKWLPRKTADLAHERHPITDWDRKFHTDIWGKKNLSPKQHQHKLRIAQQVHDTGEQGYLSPSQEVREEQQRKVKVPLEWGKGGMTYEV